MFGKHFKKKVEDSHKKDGIELTSDPAILSFELLVLKYLENYGIDKFGNQSGKKAKLSEKDSEWIDETLKAAGFNETPHVEKVVLEEWGQIKSANPYITPPLTFAKEFVRHYHNTKIEKFAPEYVIERNRKIAEAYSYLIVTIEKIQGGLDDVRLRTRIESEFLNMHYTKNTIIQCTTPFCIISMGCDEMGSYNIVYSVDYRFQKMISEIFANTLLRRMYDFTTGELEQFLGIGSLYMDCEQVFNQLLEEMKVASHHKIFIKEKHDI